MSNNINLIDKVKTNETKNERADKLKKISFFLLIMIAFLAIVIFLINYRFSVGSVRNEQNKLISQLTQYDEAAVKFFLLNKRLDDTTRILNTRSNHNVTINELTKGLPSGITIEEFELNEVNLSIVISADSLEDINDFLNKMLVLSEDGLFSNVSLEKLSIRSSKFEVEIVAIKL